MRPPVELLPQAVLVALLLALFCVLSHPKLSGGSALLTERIGWLFVATNVCNAAWICTFVWGSAPAVWVSTVFIAALEACLIAIYLRANCWREKRASLLEFVAVDVAFSAYLGWVTVRSRDLSLRPSAEQRRSAIIPRPGRDDPKFQCGAGPLGLGRRAAEQILLPRRSSLRRGAAGAARPRNPRGCCLPGGVLLGRRRHRGEAQDCGSIV